MDKFYKALIGLWQIIKNPWLLNHVLDEEGTWRKKVVRRHGFATGLPLLELTHLFPGFSETVSPFSFLDGGCIPTDLALLRGLARKYQVDDYLEIGTWRGESVANLAPLVKQAVTVNLPDAEMRAMGMDEDYIASHRFFSRGIDNVHHVQANSLTFDFTTLDRQFGLIFVDGDHHYEAVRSDSTRVLQVLKPGGIIVWHDYARNPEQVRWSVLAGILDGLPKELHSHLYHVSNTMCAVLLPELPEGVQPGILKANALPVKGFEVRVREGSGRTRNFSHS